MKNSEQIAHSSQPPKTLGDALDELAAKGWADDVAQCRQRMLKAQSEFIGSLTAEASPRDS